MAYKSDIEIAQEAKMLPIREIASQLGIEEEDMEQYGWYKAKLNQSLWNKIKDNPDGKLILVTAINPTPAGEGKTTTSVGLGQAFGHLGKKAIVALRERWRISTFISRVTFMPLRQPITFWLP